MCQHQHRSDLHSLLHSLTLVHLILCKARSPVAFAAHLSVVSVDGSGRVAGRHHVEQRVARRQESRRGGTALRQIQCPATASRASANRTRAAGAQRSRRTVRLDAVEEKGNAASAESVSIDRIVVRSALSSDCNHALRVSSPCDCDVCLLLFACWAAFIRLMALFWAPLMAQGGRGG